jgi:hypothetical protein|eukprot:30892-Pelagococcus_subviridis.AAC.6
MERPSAEWGRASLRGSRDGSVLATTSSVRRSMPTWGDVGGGGGGGGATVDVSSSAAAREGEREPAPPTATPSFGPRPGADARGASHAETGAFIEYYSRILGTAGRATATDATRRAEDEDEDDEEDDE